MQWELLFGQKYCHLGEVPKEDVEDSFVLVGYLQGL